MAISATVRGGAEVVNTRTTDLGSAKATQEIAGSVSYADGTGAGQVSKEFSDKRTIGAASSENLDLSGSLTDAFGNPVQFSAIKAIIVKADAANVGNIVLGGAASNPFVGPFADATDKITIKPGGIFVLAHPGAGWTVTAGTGDILLMANGGAADALYDIVLLGI